MSFDVNTVDKIEGLIKTNPKNSQFDWFVMGILYGHSNNTKPIEEIFNNVNNITSLSRGGALPVKDTNDFLIRIVNNLLAEDKPKKVKETENNSLNIKKASTENKNGQLKSEPVRKSSTIDLDVELSDKTGLIDDMSYKSDNDLSPTKDTARKNKNDISDFEDLMEDSPMKKVVNKNSPKQDTQNKYTRKPNGEVNPYDNYLNAPLKRTTTAEEEALSMNLIKQLEEEENKAKMEIEERKKKEDQQMNDIICSVCLSSLLDEDFIPLEACEHMFHTNCFSEYLKSEIHSRHFPIKCPSNCGAEVSQMDMVQVLDQDLVSKFYDYSLQKYVSSHADEISCCPTPNCAYAFVQDQGEDDDNLLNCPLCKKKYCLNCRVDFHKGMSCKEYQINNKRDENDIKFEKFVKGKKYKQCSKCKFWVEKNQGCDHMTCRCKYQFCYKCGGKYGDCECIKKMREAAEARQAARQKAASNKRRKR